MMFVDHTVDIWQIMFVFINLSLSAMVRGLHFFKGPMCSAAKINMYILTENVKVQ